MVIGTVVVVAWSYRQLMGSKGARVFLAVVRGVLFLLVCSLIAGPLLRLPIIENQRDWIAVLVDRSRSMSVVDQHNSDGTTQSRDDVARELLANGVWAEIDKDRETIWLGFHASAFEIDPAHVPDANGWSTDLTVPIETALRKLAGRPTSGIIVMTDGRTAHPIDRGVYRTLQERAVPVFPVAIGSAQAMTDLAIVEAEAPARAFIRDQVPVVATLRCVGGTAQAPVMVDLLDEMTGQTIDTVEIKPSEFSNQQAEAVLTGNRTEAGSSKWIVKVRAGPQDLVSANDSQVVEVDFVDRPLRILYIEGYPRWEYRYLKNMLVREVSFQSSIMLLSADRDFAQEGNAPLERLPQTTEEFDAYDLFILGDVPSNSLSSTQITQIHRSVSERGAGLLWIAGERSTPNSWIGSELEDLLPIRGVPERLDEVVFADPTESALRAGVMRLGETAGERWPIALSSAGERGRLEWAQRIPPEALKPASETLAQAKSQSGVVLGSLVVSMRFGAGLIVYVATDESWRWRHGIGETFQERYWIQFIRYLSRGVVGADGRPFQLTIEPKQPEVATPALIRVEIQDPRQNSSIGDSQLDVQIDPLEQQVGATQHAIQLTRDSTGWFGLWTAEAAGAWRIRAESASVGKLEQIVNVVRVDAELANPETDHPQLLDLATRTGGTVVKPSEIDRLTQLLPRRAVGRERSIVDPIWNSPAALFAVISLLFIEWVGRRWLRLA